MVTFKHPFLLPASLIPTFCVQKHFISVDKNGTRVYIHLTLKCQFYTPLFTEGQVYRYRKCTYIRKVIWKLLKASGLC